MIFIRLRLEWKVCIHTHDVHSVPHSHTPTTASIVCMQKCIYMQMNRHKNARNKMRIRASCCCSDPDEEPTRIPIHTIARTRSQKPNACGLQLGMSHRAQSKAKQMSAHASCVFRLNRYGRHTAIHNVCVSV